MRSALDRLADLGIVRDKGETRERFADRLAALTPNLRALTMTHYRAALGAGDPVEAGKLARQHLRAVHADLGQSVPWWKRAAASLNPIGWLLAR